MPQDSMGDKVERQVKNIKGGLKGVARKFTEEDLEPRTDAMAGRRTGRAAATKRAVVKSKEELYADAKRLGIKGRSKMTKQQLERAIRRA